MEFTRLNTSTKNANGAGEWHMVTAPRSGLQRGNTAKREGQQDRLDREFYHSLPRAHFLRPDRVHTPTEPSAFSSYRHDLSFKGIGLKDESLRDTKSNVCVSASSSPHTLAQPGFYSPRIPRTKHYEPSVSTTTSLNGCSPKKSLKEFSSHTLPLPHSKRAVLQQSGLCSKPQGIQTSEVEKPHLMRAVISQISPGSNQPSSDQFHPFKHDNVKSPCFSNPHQPSLNSSSTEASTKEGVVWNRYGQLISGQFQPTQNQTIQSSFSMEKHVQGLHEMNTSYNLPQSRSPLEQSNVHLSLESSSYQKFSLYNENCFHERPRSSPLQGNIPRPNSNSQDYQSNERKGSNDVGSCSSSNSDMSKADMNSKNVFGQPRVTASLRAACSPRSVRKSTIVEDLKKLIVMDDVPDNPRADSPFLQQTPRSSRQFPQDSASPSPLMFSSPVIGRRPLSRPNCLSLRSSPTVCEPRSVRESEHWDRDLHFNPEPLPLPSAVSDLDWNSLVSAAEAYEMQRMDNLLSDPHNTSSVPHSPAYSGSNLPHTVLSASMHTDSNALQDFPDQLSRLEVTLRRLSNDLLKEKKDKVALLAEVLKLRTSNQHLKEESLSANAQLHRIYQMFNFSP